MKPEFEEFQKISRLSRNCIITEKIDGTNGQICITAEGEMFIGSRTRWITPEEDNYGFAKWCQGHKEELMQLGEGRHFGEWWGAGIQRRYNVDNKRFSLFNTSRWQETPPPACCSVVPVMYAGIFTSTAADEAIEKLRQFGSVAAPGFMKPEGIVIYQTAGRVFWKKTLEKDDQPKSQLV